MKKIKVNCHECKNMNCSLLKHCSREWINYINERKMIFFYKKRQRIFSERAPVDGIYFILSGKVKVYKSGDDDRQQIVRLCKSGDILGHRGINRKFYPISAMALEDTYVCMILNEDFEFILKNNSELTYHLMLFLADELYNSEELVRNLAQLPVREKIAEALIRVKNVFNPAEQAGTLGVALTRQDLADVAGTTKEQISRTLSDFQDEGIIALEGKEIKILDLPRLKRIVNIH